MCFVCVCVCVWRDHFNCFLIPAESTLNSYRLNNASVTPLDCFCCVFAPHVFCDPVSPLCDLLIWFQVCLLSFLVILSLKAPVLSVSVCRSLNVFPACTPCYPVRLLKTLVCEFLVSSFRVPDQNSYLRVFPPIMFPFFFPQFFVSVVCFCSRATPDSFWSSQTSPPNRMTRSVRSMMPVWTSRAERRHPSMALVRISPPFVEWTLARNGSLFPACSQENFASSTPDPVPSPPSPRYAERMPEPTADGEPEPAATDEPSPHGATVLRIATEPEMMSVKVCEPAATPATRENTADSESAERSSAHCTAAEGELSMAHGMCHSKGVRAPIPEFGPGRATDPKSSSPSSLESPSSPLVPASRWPACSTMAPCSLLSAVAHLSTGSAGLPRPSGSALVWRRPSCASGLHSSGCALALRPSGSVRLLHPLGSSSVLCHSGSTEAIWIPISASVAGAIGSALVPQILPVTLALRLSVSTSGTSSTCSAAVGRPPGVGGHSSSMAPPSVGSTVGHHNSCGLGPARLLLFRLPPVSSLAPPSLRHPKFPPVPPHVVSMARGRTFWEGV